MKRVLSIIMAAGLALGLAGCGDSGGGYWSANPTTTQGDAPVALIGGLSISQVKGNLLTLKQSANSLLAEALNGNETTEAVPGCQAIQGLSGAPTTNLPGLSLRAPANLRLSSRARTFTPEENGYYHYVKTESYAPESVCQYSPTISYSVDYNMWIKYSGTTASPTLSESGISAPGASFMDYYGEVKVTYKYQPPALATSSSSSSFYEDMQAMDYQVVTKMGASGDPCCVQPGKTRFNGTMTVSGTMGGERVDGTVGYRIDGSESQHGYFQNGTLSAPFGFGYVTVSSDADTYQADCCGTYIEFKINGKPAGRYPEDVVATYSSSLSQP